MNLNAIAGPAVSAVNPWVWATAQRSSGYTTNPDGERVPEYCRLGSLQVQLQPLTFQDLQQLNGLNIQGERKAMYINGDYQAVMRADQRGGDLFSLPDGTQWLVAQELEDWHGTAGWVKVCVTRQMPS
ncbi:hypothetical protein [Robbsia sp. KACC 23696]|uniref:hypothetical protein n=1 Tax=Robbsia sp. KACC 23696 TaxID=3149231 RepID=UPI00325B991B